MPKVLLFAKMIIRNLKDYRNIVFLTFTTSYSVIMFLTFATNFTEKKKKNNVTYLLLGLTH